MAKNAQTAKAEKKSIFWIMQYSTPFLEVYESFKKKLGRKYRFVAPLENRNQIGILSKIIPEIITADFVIADVSTIGYDANDNNRPLYNGNVMFELGVAMAYRKKLIMISSATRKGLPFDISGYHVNEYVDSHLHMEKFIEEIRKILDNENTVYRNPVSDLDHIFTLVAKNKLADFKSVPQALDEPLTKYEVAILKYAIKDFDGVFVTRKSRGKFRITSFDRNRTDVLNENGNGETNAGYIFAIDNLVEQRKYVKVDRLVNDYSCYYRLLPSGREVAERLLKEETAESSLES